MGRKKKLTEAELENTQTTLTIEDSNQAESEEAELLAETDSEVVAEAAPEETEAVEATIEEEPVKKPRARRKRTPEIEEVVVEAVETETAEEPVKKPRKSRSKKTEAEAEAPVEISAPVQPTQDPWVAVKQLSESVALLLERTEQLRMPAPDMNLDTNEFFKPQQPPKTLFITKFATAASIVAVLLSLVSLSLSQSARQAVLGAMEPLKHSSLATTQKGSIPQLGDEGFIAIRRAAKRR